jgi:hypothetical protein
MIFCGENSHEKGKFDLFAAQFQFDSKNVQLPDQFCAECIMRQFAENLCPYRFQLTGTWFRKLNDIAEAAKEGRVNVLLFVGGKDSDPLVIFNDL